MYPRHSLPLIAIALSLAVPAQAQSVQDFSLPPAPSPSASPQAQGPVDTEGGAVPVRPRVIGTATPAPAPAPSPSAAPAPRTVATPTPSPTRQAPAAVATPRPAPVQTTQVERQPVDPRAFLPVQPQDGTPPIPAPPPAPQTQQAPASDEIATRVEQGTDWSWLVGLAAVLAVLAGAAMFWKRRQANSSAPEIEKPVVGGASVGIGPLSAGQVSGDALTIRCSAEKLIRSAAFATLKYRLTLVNRTDGPLSDVSVGIDLVSAHAGSPMEDQVATPATALEIRHTLARIAPRQNVTVEGQVQLPLAGAQVIRQGRHPLLVPLMRVRVDGAGEEPMLKTFVVGQGEPGGGRVQPFRLDEGPRSYAPIAHRELA